MGASKGIGQWARACVVSDCPSVTAYASVGSRVDNRGFLHFASRATLQRRLHGTRVKHIAP